MSWLSKATGIHLNLGPVSAATNGIGDLAMKAAPLAALIPGVGPAIGGLLGAIPGAGAVAGAASKLGSIPGLGSAASWLTGNGGKNALGLAQGINAAMLGQKSNEQARNAMGSVQSSYDERAPLRAAGIAGASNPGQGIAARIAALPQGANPYARPQMPQAPQIAPVSAGRLS